VKLKVIIPLVLLIALGFGAEISLYSQSQKQRIEKHNPLKTGTDLKFSSLFNQALEYKDIGKEKEFEEYILKSYDRAKEISDDLLICISLCWLGTKKIDDNKISEAEEILNRIKIITEKSGVDKESVYWRDLLAAYNSIQKGDYQNALILCESSWKGITAIYGNLNRFSIEMYQNMAAIYGLTGNLSKDIEYTELSLKYADELYHGHHALIAISYNNLGGVYYRKAEYDKAISYYEKSLNMNLAIFGDSHESISNNYNNLGMVYYEKGDYDRAIIYNEKSLKISLTVFGENHSSTATSYNNLALVYERKGDYNRAIEFYEKALKILIIVLGENHTYIASCYSNIGVSYQKKAEYDRAIEYYEKSLKIRLTIFGENNTDIALSYSNLGTAYEDKGVYDRAILYYEKALKIRNTVLGENHPDTATSYNNLGSVYKAKGDYERALSYYEKSLKIRLTVFGENHPDISDSYLNLGAVYDDKGDYDRAISYFERSLKLKLVILGENHPDVAICYNNLGVAYKDKGNYERAILYYENALKINIAVHGENHPSIASNYSNIGGIYDSKGDYDRAIFYHEKALKIRIAVLGYNHPETAVSYNNLGEEYRAKGDYDKAILFYEKSLKIKSVALGNKHPDFATSYNNLGNAYLGKGNYKRAIEYYKEALAINKETKRDQDTILFSQNLGLTYTDSKQYKDAYTSFLSGIETIEKVRKMNLSGGTDFTSRNISSYYYASTSGYLENDLNSMFNVSERMRAMGYIERLSLKGAIDAARIDSAQGKLLLKIKDDIERLSLLRQKLVSMEVYKMNIEQKKERDKQLEQTSKDLAQAEIDFTKLDKEFMKNEKYKLLRDTAVVSVPEAQKICGKDRAIVEYIIPEKPDKYLKPYAIIITGNNIKAVELDSGYDYSVQIEKYRKAIKDVKQKESDQLGAELYAKLIEPVYSFINVNDIKKLTIVPDGSLAFLPFDSIKTKDNRYLSERYELNLTPSITVTSMIKNRKYDKRNNLMAFGGGIYSSAGESKTRGESSFRGIIVETLNKEKLAAKAYNTPVDYYNAQQIGWADLPGTEREVSAINEKIFGKKNTEVFTGSKVSEENLKSMSKSGKLKEYSSIHLACHGYYDPEYPGYSAIVFSEVSGKLKDSKDDGYMSVEETALLNLRSDIVVLSACETGLGRMVSGDGVIGLTRAFQVAGSNGVLVTLWPVSDEATEEFMISFYKKVKEGISYSEALVKVKEEFRKSVNYSAPYFWAGFVLYE